MKKTLPSLENTLKIHKRCRILSKRYFDKSLKSTDFDESLALYDLSTLYRSFERRCYNLEFTLRFPRKFAEVSIFKEMENKSTLNFRATQKAERKKKFETIHRISVWFGHTSLRSDYGSFSCQKCGYNFYHSPSRILFGKDEQYNCVCGDCVNSILVRDGLKPAFF